MTVPASWPVRELSVVVPCLNEEPSLAQCYRATVDALGHLDLELLFVDDGSTDGTLALLQRLAEQDPRVHWISLRRNYGFEAAFTAGYRHASKEWLVHLDADLQFPPGQVIALTEAAQGMDAVFGARRQRDDPLVRRWGSRVHATITRHLLGIELPPGGTTFRLVRSEVAREVVDLRLGTPYFLATLPRVTGRWTVVPVEHRPRSQGRSRFTLATLAGHGMDLWVGFSHRLAHGAAILALVAAALLAVTLGLFAAQVVGTAALLAALAAGVLVLLIAVAAALRFLVLLGDDRARPEQYYIADSWLGEP